MARLIFKAIMIWDLGTANLLNVRSGAETIVSASNTLEFSCSDVPPSLIKVHDIIPKSTVMETALPHVEGHPSMAHEASLCLSGGVRRRNGANLTGSDRLDAPNVCQGRSLSAIALEVKQPITDGLIVVLPIFDR